MSVAASSRVRCRTDRRNGSATGYSIDGDGVFLVRINSCLHLRFRNPDNMSYFTGQYRVERLHQEQYGHVDESDWPEVPGVRYYVDDYGVRGGWQYHNIGMSTRAIGRRCPGCVTTSMTME